VFSEDSPRDDALVFGEHLGTPPAYDGYIAAGMRLVDNPLRSSLSDAISNYRLQGYDAAGYGDSARMSASCTRKAMTTCRSA
jgi:hypothetical protein